MASSDRELTAPVDLCRPDGRLDPAAVGWSRRPLHRANLRGWGRTKRWEYWCVTAPTHLVALTVSDLDFLALNSVYVLRWDDPADPADPADPTGARELERTALVPFGRGVALPQTIAGSDVTDTSDGTGTDVVVGPERPTGGRVRVEIRGEAGGTRLRARCVTPDGRPVEVDVFAALPEGHETLSVVVPWDERRFQFTSKHTARPARGTLRIGDEVLSFGGPGKDEAWAVLDHGRGRWPRSVHWNWGAASGRTDGRTVGLQFGGRWTVGTGTTENALCVDGRLTRISEELAWSYDLADPLAPWTVRTPGSDLVDLVFTPFHDRRTRTEAGLLANRTDQCFGHYDGTVRTEDGRRIAVHDLLGWAEDVRMRW
ncbi:DUF2804 domain-containing protein [Kitasatospora sp. NPDC085879]|uniref:DUF2804 domain-containing protein n=1 Tax=Kitasatospora sp. NPDC085879 TaxID=3154769 RepID=UPI003436D273